MKRSSSREHLTSNGSKNYGTDHHVVDVRTSRAGSTITAHNICYSVDIPSRPCCGSMVKKEILKNIDGVFKPGMNAILGPTGSGKSSLLDVLAGRKDPTGLTGDILIDGAPPPDNYKCMVGYVVQDDVVMGTLSVKENFHFSAALRLNKSVSQRERNERVENVIQELGLTHCADTKVGNEFIRGVSGGERKRTNIGMELIISPPVLFLDEPTTGLDSNTANSVMLLLRRLALKGRTIIFSIHQPRFSIYRLFDGLMLLSLGETVYHGESHESLEHFQSLGYTIEEHNNPPDFFLDVINGDLSMASISDDLLQKDDQLSIINTSGKGPDAGVGNTNTHDKLVQGYKKSRWYQSIKSYVEPIHNSYLEKKQAGTVVRMPKVEYATSFLTQFSVVSQRTMKNLIRNPQTSIMQVMVMVVFGAIVGAIYWQIDDDCTSGIQNRVGVFFFVVMNQVFGNLSAVELFIKERAIFMHENVSGFYRVSSYFCSKIFCDVVPMRLIPVSIFAVITYFMIGLQVDVGKFFLYLLSLFLVTLSASGFAFFFSASVRIFAVANLCIALCYVFMMVFGGLLVNLDSIADWLEWIKWFSIFRYGLNALLVNELKDLNLYNKTTGQICGTGMEELIRQGIEFESDWDLYHNYVALFCIAFILLFFSYIQLLRVKKLK
ncbi:broad substrate specificity ATP-binding cassette transporter ABCG2-like isoform X2 [Pecten maximus]|uniref:broad substrate specificity ATP-binding cassette transporter ABCG2-like isoform X2 n=1 Tax=Pecten maximus TaxID=6579 RepID=UPI001457F2B0|nr:broad substrate specificity ATP-binding cassette transporter ABCG2-like isoform X2 [Pecten maximus]